MKLLMSILSIALFSFFTPRAETLYNQEDLLDLKTIYPDSTARTIYKGTRNGKIADLELHDSNGVVVLKLDKFEGALQDLYYFKDTAFSIMPLASDSIDREVNILIDSLKNLKMRIDKKSWASGTILLWVNGTGAVEHAVWYWYTGLSRLYMRKSMMYAENWKMKSMKSGKSYVVRRNVDFK
jgi:hypothetical protein